jgi:hypothetical protein
MMTFSPAEKTAIRNCLQEISNSYIRIEAERDNVKAIIERMEEEFSLNKKLSRRLARVYHKRNIAEEVAQAEELSATYDVVVGTNVGADEA